MRARWKRYRQWPIVLAGRPWVFWPVLACGAVVGNGWGPWGSVALWVVAILAAGPGLGFVVHQVSLRRHAAAVGYEPPRP